MDARTNDREVLKADFYLCLAHAFMTPQGPDSYRAMRDDLSADLIELAGECGYDIGDDIAAYRDGMHAIGDAAALLGTYSRLFLQPPQEVAINTGVYLDGGLNGGSVAEMDDWYRAAGVARADDFHDFSDHVAVQLEYVAYAFAHALAVPAQSSQGDNPGFRHTPGRFLNRFVLRWIDAWCADIASAGEELELVANPYLPLARMLRTAARTDAEPIPALNPAQARREKALALARHKRAARGINEDDMAEMRKLLAAQGLAIDHLAPAEMREHDPWRDWKPMTPPRPR